MDRVGFRALDFTSSTHMAVSVRFHREDPWERLRLVSAAMPNTPLNLITTGMRFISWVPAGEDVMALSFRLAVRNGIRRFQIADPSNDPASLVRLARMAREAGVEEVVVGLTYSISPAHTHDYYVERAAAVAALDRHRPALPEGPRRAADAPTRCASWSPTFIAAFAPRPVELHSHCTIGLGPLAYVEGLRAGIRTLHTAVAPVANGTSNPPAETTLRNLEAEGLLARARPRGARRASPSTSARWRATAACRSARPPSTTPPTTATRCRAAWSPRRAASSPRWAAPSCSTPPLEEVTRVRDEMGYPIMVTPVSQFVATQAAMNVVSGRALARRLRRDRALLPRATSTSRRRRSTREVADRVLSLPRAAELRDLEPISLEGARERFGARHLRGGAAAAPDDAGRAGGRDGGGARRGRARRWRGPDATRSCGCWPSWPSASRSRYLRLEKGDDLVVWRRAA